MGTPYSILFAFLGIFCVSLPKYVLGDPTGCKSLQHQFENRLFFSSFEEVTFASII